MTPRGTDSINIKPLTKCTRETGERYLRRPEVKLQIEKLSSLENNEKFAVSTGDLFDETLVYFLREFRIQDDMTTVEILYKELNRRIWKLLRKFYKNFSNQADFEDFGQKVELAVIEKIFDIESNAADYAQVNFGDFVIKIAKVIRRGNLVKAQKEQEIFHTQQNDEDDENNREIQFESNDTTPEEKLILREGIAKLPAQIRQVAILILDGWQIESKDETQPTISKCLNVSSRTIRNWLKEARHILAGYEGEIR